MKGDNSPLSEPLNPEKWKHDSSAAGKIVLPATFECPFPHQQGWPCPALPGPWKTQGGLCPGSWQPQKRCLAVPRSRQDLLLSQCSASNPYFRICTPDLTRGLAAWQEIVAVRKVVERHRHMAKGCLCQDYCWWWRLGLGPGHLGADVVEVWGEDRALSNFHLICRAASGANPDCSSSACL